MSHETILHDIRDGVATVTLNNPPLNLVTLELTRALSQTLDELAREAAPMPADGAEVEEPADCARGACVAPGD